jgi:hypothetical protein
MEPIFLVGAERSGTTLLRLMLSGHPKISWLNEFEYAVDQIVSKDEWPELHHYEAYLSTNRVFLSTNFFIDKSLSYPDLIKSFLLQKKQRENKLIVGATCHRHYDRILRLFPKARFIHIVRDPRDVAKSNIGMGWAGNVWIGVDRWIKAETLWSRIKQDLNVDDEYIEIKYESLIKSTDQVLRNLCRFLKVKYNPAMLDYPNHTTYSLPDPSFVEQWVTKLSRQEIALVEYKAGSLMKERGYGLRTKVSNSPSLILLSWLQFQNRLFRFKFRIKQFGLKLTLTEMFVRRFKMQKYENEIKMKIIAIQKSRLK